MPQVRISKRSHNQFQSAPLFPLDFTVAPSIEPGGVGVGVGVGSPAPSDVDGSFIPVEPESIVVDVFVDGSASPAAMIAASSSEIAVDSAAVVSSVSSG